MPPTPTPTNAPSKILRLMLGNFFLWLLPGVVIFAFSFVLLFILMVGSAVVDVEFNIRMFPKGLVSFLGISYVLAGIGLMVLPFILSDVDAQSLVFIIGGAITTWIIAYVMLKAEWQRLAVLV